MKAEHLLLLAIIGVILYQHSKQQTSIHWVSCDDPSADPVMCGLLGQ